MNDSKFHFDFRDLLDSFTFNNPLQVGFQCPLTNSYGCKLPQNGELRGRSLQHLLTAGHMGKYQGWIQSKIKEIGEKIELSQKVLNAGKAGKLPEVYLIGSSEEDCKFVETSKFIDKEESKLKKRQAKKELWLGYQKLFDHAVESVNNTSQKLARVNSVAMKGTAEPGNLQDVLKDHAQNDMPELKHELKMLKQLIESDKSQIDKPPLQIEVSYGELTATVLCKDEAIPSKLKVVGQISAAVDEMEKYISLFENCVAGMNASLSQKV